MFGVWVGGARVKIQITVQRGKPGKRKREDRGDAHFHQARPLVFITSWHRALRTPGGWLELATTLNCVMRPQLHGLRVFLGRTAPAVRTRVFVVRSPAGGRPRSVAALPGMRVYAEDAVQASIHPMHGHWVFPPAHCWGPLHR